MGDKFFDTKTLHGEATETVASVKSASASAACISALEGEIDRRDAVLDWLRENMPRALELCPYKLGRPATQTERSVMDDAAQKAIDVLTAIAKDENADDDTRIRAACAILGHTESVRQGHTAPVPA